MAARKNHRDVDYLFDTALFSHALAHEFDEALKENLGGGTLDEEHDDTNNGSSGALPVSSGGEAEAWPEAKDIIYGKYGSQRG